MDLGATDIDFTSIVESGGEPCKGLYLTLIQDAINDYLYFGLKTKYLSCTVDEFLAAYNYLFITRSTDKSTWLALNPFPDENETELSITEEQLKLMCFDVHVDITRLSDRIKIPYLLNFLKAKRGQLVEQNYPRFLRKINCSKKKHYRSLAINYKTVNLNKEFVTKTLVEPRESDLLSLYFGDIDEVTA